MNTVSGFVKPDHGYLEGWAQQGESLLLRTVDMVQWM